MDTVEFEGLFDFFRLRGTLHHYRKGELIVHAADEPFGVFYITEGFVKVFSASARGDKYVHVVYGPSEVFPVIWLVRHVRRRMFYDALSPCVLLRVPPAELEAVMHSQPNIGFEMFERTVEQFGVFLDRINNLQYRFARERLVCCLLNFARRFGAPTAAGYEITVRISHQVIASDVNLSRESVGRELDRLVRKGMVRVQAGHIVLIDVPALIAQLPGSLAGVDWGELVVPEAPTGLVV